ncbi:ATP-binding protein [Mariniphaga sp.]|uniref:PAS domain-containing sensor histidine kinase n=1 Tax=Mariniphaga sp. TaxID=1954475 RepID=UPI0035681494
MKQINKKGKNRYFHYQKEILNTISETASFIDKNYRYVFVNTAFNKFFRKETEEVVGKKINELWNSDDFEHKIRPAMEKCMRGKPVFLLFEGLIPTGENKILEWNFYPHRNSNGRIDGLISTAKDVTEHKKSEQALLESEARFKELNATKDKLFSIIGHDLKGPLNNILGFSELIDQNFDTFSEKEKKQYVKLIYKSSVTVTELLENLLTWSRAQRNILTVSPHNIAVYFTIEKCFGQLIQNALQKEIRLKNNIQPETVVYADEEMITTVIRNLVSNAIKFTHRGGTISVISQSSPEQVLLGIKDTGIGIAPEIMSQLFKPNENHTSLGTEGEKGTGLGLIICKDLVEKNNGKIWVESTLEQGTTFWLTFPPQKLE